MLYHHAHIIHLILSQSGALYYLTSSQKEEEVQYKISSETPRNFFWGVGLGFELRALCLQSRHATGWITPLVYFALVILEIGVS
jgi:hypothetical protein